LNPGGLSDLPPIDAYRLMEDTLAVFVNWEWEFEQYQTGLVERLPVDGYRAHLQRYPYMIEQFDQIKTTRLQDWVEFMEREVIPVRDD